MPVDTSEILHVLAHELRTPVGIAQGYARLLLDDRLTAASDRVRALQQMQKALGRLSDLTHEATALAGWYERHDAAVNTLAAETLLERVIAARYDYDVSPEIADLGATVVRTTDASALEDAIITVVRATARELRGAPCAVAARVDARGRLEIRTGAREKLDELGGGPDSNGATPLVLERGGLGLALVRAAVVLDAHGAERWTVHESRQTAALRFPAQGG